MTYKRTALEQMVDELQAMTLLHDKPYTGSDMDAVLALAAKHADGVREEFLAEIGLSDESSPIVYAERFQQFLNDSDFGVYEWKGWQVLADWATGTCDLYDPYGTFVSQCDTFEEAARKAAQIDEAW